MDSRSLPQPRSLVAPALDWQHTTSLGHLLFRPHREGAQLDRESR